MGIRFSKSIKLGNYLRLNPSKSGISANIGKKGASVTVGKRGTYLNLSPALLGIKGTGLSYRKKLDAKEMLSGAASQINALKQEQAEAWAKPGAQAEAQAQNKPDFQPVFQEYQRLYEERVHLHRSAQQVLDREGFRLAGEMLETAAARELYELCLSGDEDTIESFIASFMNHLELPYDARVNYELQDDVLMVDLDLPEIEDFPDRYPEEVKGKLVEKRKLKADLREEYASAVLSLGLFLAAGFFNVSPCIRTIIMSAFTTVRNSAGDLTDRYLYSVKFSREVFEAADLSVLDTAQDMQKFLLNFENRINLSGDGVFKAVTPYEEENEEGTKDEGNEVLEEALLALKELGFSDSDISRILPELRKAEADAASDLVKQALNLFSKDS